MSRKFEQALELDAASSHSNSWLEAARFEVFGVPGVTKDCQAKAQSNQQPKVGPDAGRSATDIPVERADIPVERTDSQPSETQRITANDLKQFLKKSASKWKEFGSNGESYSDLSYVAKKQRNNLTSAESKMLDFILDNYGGLARLSDDQGLRETVITDKDFEVLASGVMPPYKTSTSISQSTDASNWWAVDARKLGATATILMAPFALLHAPIGMLVYKGEYRTHRENIERFMREGIVVDKKELVPVPPKPPEKDVKKSSNTGCALAGGLVGAVTTSDSDSFSATVGKIIAGQVIGAAICSAAEKPKSKDK